MGQSERNQAGSCIIEFFIVLIYIIHREDLGSFYESHRVGRKKFPRGATDY